MVNLDDESKRIRTRKGRAYYEGLIENKHIVSMVDINNPQDYTTSNLGAYMEIHDGLYNGKAAAKKEIRHEIITRGRELLRHHYFCNVELTGEKKVRAEVQMAGVLPEQTPQIYGWWQGKVLDPSAFKSDVAAFESFMRSHNVISAAAAVSPVNHDKVAAIRLHFSFA